jgi:hypothetical protein
MKWVIAALLIVSLLVSAAEDKCSVREFYGIAYKIHNPSERHQQMSMWLNNHQNLCSSKDMVVIWNNLSEWGGSADSAELRHLVVRAYKNALEREKK